MIEHTPFVQKYVIRSFYLLVDESFLKLTIQIES